MIPEQDNYIANYIAHLDKHHKNGAVKKHPNTRMSMKKFLADGLVTVEEATE